MCNWVQKSVILVWKWLTAPTLSSGEQNGGQKLNEDWNSLPSFQYNYLITLAYLFQIALEIIWLPMLIVSITKFSIVIGSPRTHLTRKRRAIAWVSNYWYPFELFVIGHYKVVIEYIRVSYVSYTLLNGFLPTVFYSFQNLWKALQTFSLKRSCQKTLLIPKFVIDTINW